jgi:hypothetical protein
MLTKRVVLMCCCTSYSSHNSSIKAEDIPSLRSIVQTPPVAQALAAGVYDSTVLPMFDTFTHTGVAWSNSSSSSNSSNSQLQQLDVDAVIWATGYNNATQYLLPLGVLG